MNKDLGAQEPIANLIIKFASRVADKADDVSTRLSGRLVSVMTSDKPTIQGTGKAEQPREYPPLFDELRNKLQVIENALYSIENCLSRTEL